MEFYLSAEINSTAANDVSALSVMSDDFLIAADRQGGDVGRSVEDDKNRSSSVLSGNNINASIRYKLRHCAFADDLITLSPVQQTAEPTEHAVLRICAPFSCKSISAVIPEAAREILPHIAVALCFRAIQQDFHTIIKLRNAIDGQQ